MILLITCFPWDDVSGGAVIVRNDVQVLSNEVIHWFALSRPTGRISLPPPNVEHEFRAPPARGNVRLKLNRFWRWYARSVWADGTARVIARRIRELQPRLVWLVADFGIGPIGRRLLPMLSQRRVHISLHDNLEATASREGYSGKFIGEIHRFLAGLRNIQFTADAVSEELLQECAPTAQSAAVITAPVDPTKCAYSFQAPGDSGRFRIGFSGNFLGEEEFRCFVEGLKMWSKKTGRDWQILVFGRSDLGKVHPNVEAYSYTPADEVRTRLSECDILLLPSPVEREEMKTNMPTKLITYIETGRMIFCFAPEGSAVQRVLHRAKLGPVLTSRDAALAEAALLGLQEWDFAAAAAGWRSLIEDRFNKQRITRDVLSLFGHGLDVVSAA
jgi:glycosyltransferase involved in cell wall biosynthesis